jgi:hypothetical protein
MSLLPGLPQAADDNSACRSACLHRCYVWFPAASARWRAFTRYQISLRFNNRPAPKDNSTTVRPVQLWVAAASEKDAKGTGFVVRGRKTGTVCSLR